MWSDRSKRPLIVIGALVIVAALGVLVAYRSSTSEERRVGELIDMAYEYAEVEPGPKLLYNRQEYAACEGGLTGDDAWAGFQGSTTGTAELGDVSAGAERAAGRLEADGWDVVRYLVPEVGGGGPVTDIRYVYAHRGEDDLFFDFSTIKLDIVAGSGPCIPGFEFPPEPPRPADLVERFPSS